MQQRANMRKNARKSLNRELGAWIKASKLPRPRDGWLRSVREALGMTTRQFAARLNTNLSAAIRLEEREQDGTLTLQSLEKAARALGCKFVYAVVPEPQLGRNLDELLRRQAERAAKAEVASAAYSMMLEDQSVSAKVTKSQTKAYEKQLIETLDSRIWDLRK